MKNKELASLLYDIADILELEGVEWKPRAYRRAAQGIESLTEDIEKIYKSKGIKGLKEIPGVGEAIAKHIEEYLLKGKVRKWENLKRKVPPGLKDLMEISSLGPKKAIMLYKELNIKNISDLKKALQQHKIAKLEGFGEKSEENILKGLEFFEKSKERKLLGEVLPIAEELVRKLKEFKYINKITYAGSLRRMKETIGDIDLLATSSNPKKVMEFFTSLPEVKRVLAKGMTKSMVILDSGIQADLRVLKNEEYGAALQYFTGNKEHNIKLREIAIKKGYKLNEYGLFKDKKRIAGRTEKEIYEKLGLKFIPPELRHNTGEIEAAIKGELPKLVKIGDIKGDLHVHSKYSDGSDEIEKIVKEAKSLGYEYIAITDHSKSRAIAHGLNEERLREQWKEIDRINKKQKKEGRKIMVLKGTECDILSDGSLDYKDSILRKFDIVVGSIHSGFKSSKREMTERICKALENKYLTILGHPTGRLINTRPAYEVDLEQVFEVAKEKKKFLEVNAFPSRLDLKDVYIRTALNIGCKISLGTDSHSFYHLYFMKYGVAQARRGWAEKKDVLNTLSLKKLFKVLRK